MKLQKIHNQISLHNNSYLIDKVFFKDNKLEYIFKKTERISMAVYLITNFLVSEEPLKWSLRNSATKVLNNVLSYSTSSLSHREKNGINLHYEILSLVSYFDLAFNSGFISAMNYEIMAAEIDKLILAIQEYNSNTLNMNKGLFDQNYFHVEKSHNDNIESEQGGIGQNDGNGYFSRTDIKDNIKDKFNNDFNLDSKEPQYSRNHAPKSFNPDMSDRVLKTNNTKKTAIKDNPINLKRQEKIISEVKRQKIVSVKDIAGVLPNYSAKTLQRELIAMVEAGILIKTGERRWSRYSLK